MVHNIGLIEVQLPYGVVLVSPVWQNKYRSVFGVSPTTVDFLLI